MKLNKTIIVGLMFIIFAGLIFVTDIFNPIIRPITYQFLMGSSKGKDIIFFGLFGLFLSILLHVKRHEFHKHIAHPPFEVHFGSTSNSNDGTIHSKRYQHGSGPISICSKFLIFGGFINSNIVRHIDTGHSKTPMVYELSDSFLFKLPVHRNYRRRNVCNTILCWNIRAFPSL